MLVLALFLGLLPQAAPTTDDPVALLRSKDQALLDAIAPGNKKVWEETLAADAVYVDESGAVLNRGAFLDQLNPLPAGVSGNLKISNYQAHVIGDLAMV